MADMSKDGTVVVGQDYSCSRHKALPSKVAAAKFVPGQPTLTPAGLPEGADPESNLHRCYRASVGSTTVKIDCRRPLTLKPSVTRGIVYLVRGVLGNRNPPFHLGTQEWP